MFIIWVRARLCNLQKRCTRLAAASDQVYQLLVHGRWFSPGTPASSTTKTGRHDIAEILQKVALNSKNHHQIIIIMFIMAYWIVDYHFLHNIHIHHGEVWVHIYVSVPRQESERLSICVLGVFI